MNAPFSESLTFEITLPTKVFQFFNDNLFCKAQTELGFSDSQL